MLGALGRRVPARAARTAATPGQPSRQGRLLRKYVWVLGGLVSVALFISGLVDIWFSLQESQATILRVQQEKALQAAIQIRHFVADVERNLQTTLLPDWLAQTAAADERTNEYRRLLRLQPSVTEVSYVDSEGRESIHLSRLDLNRPASGRDLSASEPFVEARRHGVYYGPVVYRNESEPYMTIAVAERGATAGVVVAEVNLKQMWDVIQRIRVGQGGFAYVVDGAGRLVAHKDLSLVLQNTSFAHLPQVANAIGSPARTPEGTTGRIERDYTGAWVLTAYQPIQPPGWYVFAEQPFAEAFAPVGAVATRAVLVLLVGVLLAVLASLLLARWMVKPIEALQQGAARIGAGALDQRIMVRTDDELEQLAEAFNRMAHQLYDSYSTLEQRVEERTHELAVALAELEEKRRELEIASQHKSALLSTVSHELRTPLATIKGFGTMMLKFGPRIRAAERREYLESMDHATDRLAHLIDDLLDAQRLEGGRLPINPEPLDLPSLCAEVTTELANHSTAHRFVCALPESLPLVNADPKRTRQVLGNLLENAVKYSPEGGEVRIDAAIESAEVIVAVHDEGVGIPAEHLSRVFEPFHRVDSSLTRTTRGTGLGLAICQGIVQAHGGRIWAESAGPGQGSTFRFTLPRWDVA